MSLIYRNWSIIFMFTKVDHLTNFNQRLIPDWTCSSQVLIGRRSSYIVLAIVYE